MKRAKSKNYENEEVKKYKNMKLNKKYLRKKWEMAQMKTDLRDLKSKSYILD